VGRYARPAFRPVPVPKTMTSKQRKPSYTSWLGAQLKEMRLETTWGAERSLDGARILRVDDDHLRRRGRRRGRLSVSEGDSGHGRSSRPLDALAGVRSEVAASAIALFRAACRRQRAAAAGCVAGLLPVDGASADARGRPRGGAGVRAPLGDAEQDVHGRVSPVSIRKRQSPGSGPCFLSITHGRLVWRVTGSRNCDGVQGTVSLWRPRHRRALV